MSNNKTKFIAIAACAFNRVIGVDNHLPWRLQDDYRWFKMVTMDHTIVMGRKTFESIGRPLPRRTTIVLSRSGFHCNGIDTFSDFETLLNSPLPDLVYIVGGGQIYQQALPYCSELLLTLVKGNFEGDTYFPEFQHLFDYQGTLVDNEQFVIMRYTKKNKSNAPQPIEYQRFFWPNWGLKSPPTRAMVKQEVLSSRFEPNTSASEWIDTPDSEAIEGFGYSPARQELEVKFKHGKTYAYLNVPRRIFEEMRRSHSRGEFLVKIKSRYRFKLRSEPRTVRVIQAASRRIKASAKTGRAARGSG